MTEPLYKRYEHFYDNEENSSGEERYARAKFSKIAQMASPLSVAGPLEQHMTDFVKSIVFDMFFGVSESMPPPSQKEDTPELYRDKILFAQCKNGSKAFLEFLGKHKESLKSRMRSKFTPKSPMLAFHAELFKWQELHRVNKKDVPKGAYNIWNNELIRAGTACTQLVIHPIDRDPHKGDTVPEPFGAYFTREQADVLVMCHNTYFFLGYTIASAYDAAPDGNELDGKSFYDTWLFFTGGNEEPVDKWSPVGASVFVKTIVHLRDTLKGTLSWLE